MMRNLVLFAVATGAALVSTAVSLAQFTDTTESEKRALTRLESYGYVLEKAKWQTTTINVCWENSDAKYNDQMELVRDSVTASWEKHSKLKFRGWLKCTSRDFIGIRIQIADIRPHVKQLGAYISNVPNGMVLNFEFTVGSFRACRENGEKFKNDCIKSIAVHEFGHAIAFAHEHNRLDRDADCFKPPQGPNGDVMLTPYDPKSVMNYCNPVYNNGGELSDGDIKSVQIFYGKP